MFENNINEKKISCGSRNQANLRSDGGGSYNFLGEYLESLLVPKLLTI